MLHIAQLEPEKRSMDGNPTGEKAQFLANKNGLSHSTLFSTTRQNKKYRLLLTFIGVMRLNQILNSALALIPRNHSLEQQTVIIPADDVGDVTGSPNMTQILALCSSSQVAWEYRSQVISVMTLMRPLAHNAETESRLAKTSN